MAPEAMSGPESPSDDMGEGVPSRFNRSIVVIPPFVFDSELGVTAVDVAVTGQLPKRTSGRAAICFGGHPPAECLLDITGSGTDHQIVVAIDPTQPRHQRFALRLRHIIKSQRPVHVIPLPQETREFQS